ncbi:SRPBCC family protein [Galbitalea soli]|uniref:SRPBCC family protein n=1 Tax=Galbitalea soli TaxID=1268042 RepID=A0A7C9PMK2_9MICO|nr:SRPBCC family protein [Galbitalea soli]NEM90808.1 hypothetical protein [Galbitalea soli]NYJ31526.1 uncharacterized protein YndB with AHSA1/START domain [Galbitalea soli]
MAHAEHRTTVSKPIEEVFAFLADGLNNPRWRPEVREISHVSGTGVGAVYAQTMTGPGGRAIAGDYRVTEYRAPTRLAFEVIAGPARPTGVFTLVSTGPTTTDVTFAIDLTPTGLMRLMSRMIAAQVESEAANIARLPAALDGTPL